jgi:DNA-binding transcriptional ArsR family regulator
MSIETGSGHDQLPAVDLEDRRGPRPAAHGAAVSCHYNDRDLDVGAGRGTTIYDQLLETWRSDVGDKDLEPYVIAELDNDLVEWLPNRRDYVVVLKSSRWKAGTGTEDDGNYSAYYEYDLILRERTDDGDLRKPPLSINLSVTPQYSELNYADGNDLNLPYGEGTRVTTQTTWSEDPDEIRRRSVDVLVAAIGADRDAVELARDPDSRRIQKAEAHVRFDIDAKNQMVDAIRHTEDLIAYGGRTEIESHRKRQQEGWVEARCDADRWDLLGFNQSDNRISLKCYQATNWADRPRSDSQHHPKVEAAFNGKLDDERLPHVDEWDEIMSTLRSIVSSHCDWAGVGRADLVADDFQDGPALDEYAYRCPSNRRDQLRARYEDVATDIYQEALKTQTTAVYDILSTISRNCGASYDQLEYSTGLARSTIRYHIRRLDEKGVIDRVQGSETLVVYPSPIVLDKADEILDRVYSGDLLEDLDERAEERRERRENLDDQDDDHDGAVDDDDVDQDDRDDDRDEPASWSYFRDLELEPHQLANALERDYLDDDEVKIRVDRRDWITPG